MMMKIEVKRERESERGKKTKEGACSGGISSFVYIYEKKGSQGELSWRSTCVGS